VPLIERLSLPADVRARANPKSSTGRLDVFTRLITDRHNRFDDIRPGYEGQLYLEVVPRSFAVQVRTGLPQTAGIWSPSLRPQAYFSASVTAPSSSSSSGIESVTLAVPSFAFPRRP
jgi:2'-deoxycytidine 5'-triphosphate deaminase (DCD)